MTPPELDDDHVAVICRVLAAHGVAFVVIGGVAARLHETGYATVDIDVCPARDADNLRRLAAALQELGARLRVEGDSDGVALEPDPELLANMTTMTLLTRRGPLDGCFAPAGFARGYDELAALSVVVRVLDVDVPVASLEDVVASKRASTSRSSTPSTPTTASGPRS